MLDEDGDQVCDIEGCGREAALYVEARVLVDSPMRDDGVLCRRHGHRFLDLMAAFWYDGERRAPEGW